MTQGFLKIVLILFIAIGLGLYLFNPGYSVIFVKGFFLMLNLIFATFVFRHLLDMNAHYQNKVYPIFFIISFGLVLLPILIFLGLIL